MSTVETMAATDADNNKSVQVLEPRYFPVSITKLFVLSTCTLGLYEIFWFYRNWQLIKQRENSEIMPVWRSIFGYLFCYSLFRRVQKSGSEIDADNLPAGPLAAGWIITTLLWKLPDPYWLVTFLAVLFLLPVQHAANRINATQAFGHDPNARFSGWNIATAIIGGILLVLSIIGTLLPGE